MSVLQNVSNAAVWGSLTSTAVLGTYHFVQGLADRERRARFTAFSAVCAVIVAVDFLHPQLAHLTYEAVRGVLWSLFAGCLLWLFGYRLRIVVPLTAALPGVGALVWLFWEPELATTFVLPLGFAVAAVAHAHQFMKREGYASCMLCTYSTLLTMMCSLYYRIVSTGDQHVIAFGYAHYALVSALAILFGWIHLPRELRGKAPVRLKREHALFFLTAMVATEVALQFYLLRFFSWPPYGYLVLSGLQVILTLVLFFHNRHQLVIFTDNVVELLEERTASLRAAQRELARQNEVQAEKLEAQSAELQAKAEVIDRQRRLELAAQTAGQVAHDIQNLIAPMQVELDSFMREARPDTSGLHRLHAVQARIGELLELNGQLLGLSRRGRRERFPVALTDVVNDVQRRFPAGRVIVETAGAPWITGSWSQVVRAVSNLVVNGLDATAGRERVILRAGLREFSAVHQCHLGFLKAGAYSFIEVEDHGSGIATEDVEKIFEPFFSRKSGPGRSGSGLGLSIVAAVMDDHEGVLDLQSAPGNTCFTLYFPAAPIPVEASTADQLCGSETVVVIDDDRAVRAEYGGLLEKAGYYVIYARDGDEALKILQAEQADLLVLDLKMPRRQGPETLFAALQLRPGLRTIVHSSYISKEDEIRLAELGVDTILHKPANHLQFLKSVRSALLSSAGRSTVKYAEAAGFSGHFSRRVR